MERGKTGGGGFLKLWSMALLWCLITLSRSSGQRRESLKISWTLYKCSQLLWDFIVNTHGNLSL